MRLLWTADVHTRAFNPYRLPHHSDLDRESRKLLSCISERLVKGEKSCQLTMPMGEPGSVGWDCF
jgi:hypothetical protein